MANRISFGISLDTWRKFYLSKEDWLNLHQVNKGEKHTFSLDFYWEGRIEFIEIEADNTWEIYWEVANYLAMYGDIDTIWITIELSAKKIKVEY